VGIILIIASLLFDGLIATQTDINHKKSGNDYAYSLMFSTNVVHLILNSAFIFFYWFINNDDTLSRVFSNPVLLKDVIMIGASGALGQIFIYLSISLFNSHLLSVITTSRKLFSVVFSNIQFHHHFTPLQWLGAMLVMVCTFAEMYIGKKNKDKEKAEANAAATAKVEKDKT
jgi:solute carrier family 35 (UDP-galactose transporter), member B1